jgi:hypothetical protein
MISQPLLSSHAHTFLLATRKLASLGLYASINAAHANAILTTSWLFQLFQINKGLNVPTLHMPCMPRFCAHY